MKRKGLFITGTDTDVGKTYITTQIIRQLKANAVSIKVRKPIESGCLVQNENYLHPEDGFALWQASDKADSLETVTPYRFIPAVAPNRAATLAHKTITSEQLMQACLKGSIPNDFLIVEGAGGFYSPLSSDGLNVDLASLLKLNIVLIVKDKLGCINHTLLTLNAIKKAELNCIAIILNLSTKESIDQYDHLNELKQQCHIPIYNCYKDGTLDNITDSLLIE